ncbi:radical SAM family heme chaperone HemW [Marinilabiliaceae bacterium JC017]|nr:radical SAM family heme chaperone HemW [Marinilabiliaceae bacterium JC017]
MAGIYIHIPFCYKRCHYCDFYKSTNFSLKNEYLKSLFLEIESRKDFLKNESIQTVYFGGGTPSVLTVVEIDEILNKLRAVFDLSAVKEITLEMNPDDALPQYLGELRKIGINRLSVGIQSFNDQLLTLLNRRHDTRQAENVISMMREAGFDNFSIDLMYGLPSMDIDTWKASVNKAIGFNPPHISAYHLTFEKGTRFYEKLKQGLLKEASEDESLQQFQFLVQTLKANGYDHYEISNFAKPGKQSQHNSSYWAGLSYLGLGPSAHSFDGKMRQWNISDINTYITGLSEVKDIFESETLSLTDIYNELIMIQLRTAKGLDLELMQNKVGEKLFTQFMTSIKKHETNGNVVLQDGFYRVRKERLFVTDNIIADLFYCE